VLAARDMDGLMGMDEVTLGRKIEFGGAIASRVEADGRGGSVHDKLMDALVAESQQLPKKGKAGAPWYERAAADLEPAREVRNRAVAKFMASRLSGRVRAKRRLTEVRKEWRHRVKVAKSEWVEEQCAQINNECVAAFDCGKKVWDAIARLKGGLQKTAKATAVPLKKKSGEVCVGAAENAQRFKEHFVELYGREEWFDERALDSIVQHEVREEAGRVPDDEEIRAAVKRLNSSSPGKSGVGAVAVKAAIENARGFALVREMVLEFWEGEVAPASWEDGLLKILPKSGDLSQPGNYRGIMLLEVLYKVIANIIKTRLTPIQESLEQESQCGFRPGRGCSDASFSLRMAIKKRREHGMETWVLLLDLVKAFDRVPRTLLWRVMRKFGVPAL